MKHWKISKIKISNFKPFEEITIDLKCSSLITLDGPNGFGKTSIYDALELLFTGEIKRIVERNKNTLAKGTKKKIFEENLYWNKRKLGDLVIRAELICDGNEDSLYLARVGLKSKLQGNNYNAPDDFSVFKLYQLESFESVHYKNEVDISLLETYLGVNFLKNFSLLNYLEQGENRYLHSTKIDERKKGIEHLISTDQLSEKVRYYRELEKIITNEYTGKAHIDKLALLHSELAEIEAQINTTSSSNHYKRLSTSTTIPRWDQQSPIKSHDTESLNNLLEDVNCLIKIVSHPDEVKIRKSNHEIDKLVQREEEVKLALNIGFFINSYDDLKFKNDKLLDVKSDIEILKVDSHSITKEKIKEIKSAVNYEELANLIDEREKLSCLVDSESKNLLKFLEAKEDLLSQFSLHRTEGEPNCPFCEIGWESRELLVKSAQFSIEKIKEKIDGNANDLKVINKNIKSSMLEIKSSLLIKKESIEKSFNKSLYDDLQNNIVRFESIKKLLELLAKYNVFPSKKYEEDSIFRSDNFDAAKLILLQSKQVELIDFPYNWKEMIESSFIDHADFYKVSLSDLKSKLEYIKNQYNKMVNSSYQHKLQQLSEHRKKIDAGEEIKRKIVKARKKIEEVIASYTRKVIGDIELLFHLYSGRLIQNYQRGLGLFLSSNEGKSLKFSTVEHSEHDAILSMSSGQIAALGVAFFLTLNKVYSSNSFILIDDPVQSMDEINIASLSDLFRVEFQDKQVIISNHEESISNYMRYKYKRAGLSQLPINMLDVTSEQAADL